MSFCNDFIINKKCNTEDCINIHKKNICSHFWRFSKCKFGDDCRFIHLDVSSNINVEAVMVKKDHKKKYNNKQTDNKQINKKRNTLTFKPIKKDDVDMRIVFHDVYKENNTFDKELKPKDVVLVSNLFNDFKTNEIYNMLVDEINSCGIHPDKLLKSWHGDSHLIADDKLHWKNNCPTFNMVIERIKEYFNMDIQATRFNWYKDTSQWKPYHFDASAIDPEKAKIQNFTLAVSFGATRETSFERDTRDKTKISIPISDGDIYAFCKDTNILWRHGILKEDEIKDDGRISIIAWGWMN